MVHNPKHKVHSFRGLLGDGGEDEINLERQNVNLAYRITKFQVMSNLPVTASGELIVKIYRESQSSITNTVDFSDTDLLGVALFIHNDNYSNTQTEIIFDNVLFSRNIFVGYASGAGSNDCNYYIEIEEVPVSASTLMQLKLGVARRLNLEQ